MSHSSGYIHLLYPKATIDPKIYDGFSSKLRSFLVPPDDAPDRRIVEPRLPDPGRVEFVNGDEPLGITPEMEYREVADRLRALRKTNISAALAPYAGHELGEIDAFPFVKASLERCPVSKGATLEEIAALPNESIYDGSSRSATPDEVWNFGRGDGFEKCLLAANALSLKEGAIDVALGEASLVSEGREICRFPAQKRPKDRVEWKF